MLEVVVDWRAVRERRWLEHRVVHHGAIGRIVRSRRADSLGAGAPDLLKLVGRNISAVVGSNGSPELLAASLVDGTKAVGVDNLGLVGDLGVDSEGVVWLGGLAGSHGARLG